jgi:hypothetical protein
MNCEQFEAIVNDLKRPGALDEATCTLAQFHAQSCESCEARLAQARSLTAGLGALHASQGEEGAPARVEAMLRSAFLRNQWEIARAKTMRRWTAVGIAAALLIAGGMASLRLRRPQAPAEIARTMSATRTAEPHISSPPAELQTADARNDDEFPADFQPYPAGGAIVPFESGEVVRVSLSGSALVAMGFPVDGDRAGDRFTADVLVGEDGLPRAIRFPQ